MPSFAEFQAAASTLYGSRGEWSYDMWAAINRRFWDGQLTPGPIHWGLTAGCSFGWFLGHGHSGQITIHEALTGTAFDDWVMADRSQARSSWNLPPSAFGIGTALGTLLHESMHQAHYQRRLEYGLDRMGNREPHHCQTWVDECARIAPMVGLPTLTWPVYIERKESIEQVFNRIERQHTAGNSFNPNNFSRNELSNRRQWIQVPTINGEQINPADWDGPPLATTGEITMFPRATYERMGLPPADRVGLILAAAESVPAPVVITPEDTTPASSTAANARLRIRRWIKANPDHTNLPAAQQWLAKLEAAPRGQLHHQALQELFGTPSDTFSIPAATPAPRRDGASPAHPAPAKKRRFQPLADLYPRSPDGLAALLKACNMAGSQSDYARALGVKPQAVSYHLGVIRKAVAAAN